MQSRENGHGTRENSRCQGWRRSGKISIKHLALLIARLTGFNGELIWDASKPNAQPRRALDTSRGERYFAFRAQVSLEEGLRRTIEWYKDNN